MIQKTFTVPIYNFKVIVIITKQISEVYKVEIRIDDLEFVILFDAFLLNHLNKKIYRQKIIYLELFYFILEMIKKKWNTSHHLMLCQYLTKRISKIVNNTL